MADYASFARIPARGQDKIACKMKRTSTLQASREAVIDHAKSRDVRKFANQIATIFTGGGGDCSDHRFHSY